LFDLKLIGEAPNKPLLALKLIRTVTKLTRRAINKTLPASELIRKTTKLIGKVTKLIRKTPKSIRKMLNNSPFASTLMSKPGKQIFPPTS
jgi:hypothetical protein